MSYADRDRPVRGKVIGFIIFIALLPILAIFLVLKLVMLPFERPSHRTAEEVARYLRDFIHGTGGERDYDDFTSIPLADPQLESIRERAGQWLGGEDVSVLLALIEEAEAVVEEDRERLIELLRRALVEGNVTDEMIDVSIPNPRRLGPIETGAYQALSHWADDDDIRARDVAYAQHQREQLAQALTALSELPTLQP